MPHLPTIQIVSGVFPKVMLGFFLWSRGPETSNLKFILPSGTGSISNSGGSSGMEIKESVTTKVLDPWKNTTKFGRMDGPNNDGPWEDVYYIKIWDKVVYIYMIYVWFFYLISNIMASFWNILGILTVSIQKFTWGYSLARFQLIAKMIVFGWLILKLWEMCCRPEVKLKIYPPGNDHISI